MTTYQVTPELAGWSFKRKTLSLLWMAGLFAGLEIAFDFLFPSLSSSVLWWKVIEAVISGFIFSVLMEAFFKRKLGYKVIVSNDRITAVHPWFERSVEKNCIRTIMETRGNPLTAPALRISKHGRLGMFLWGYVSIPKALPEYESIRALAMSWKTAP